MIDLYIDFKCPASYLALQPTLAMSDKLDVAISWHALRSYQAPLLQEKPDEEVGERHRRVRALARQKTHMLYAGVQNLPMQFRDPPTSADMALAALCVWTGDADLDDGDIVAALSGAPSLPDAESARRQLEAALKRSEERGIFASPTYVVNEQIFVGRENLPWISEILQPA
jgi:2-hydroxychromene-2-carboxylate isomerase